MLKRNGTELTTGIITLVLAAAATVLFCLSYTTGYYIFGQMNSGLIALLLGAGIAVGIVTIFLRGKFADQFWPLLLTFAVTALLTAAAMLLLGDRVEGIGNCIVTDYDSGHGGEEAIYMSLAAVILLVCGVIYNIIGSFAGDKAEEPDKNRKIMGASIWGATALAVLLGVLIPTGNLVRGSTVSGDGSGVRSAADGAGKYTVSYNANNGNAEDMPDYQFLCSNFRGMVNADSRFFVDLTLTLDGSGGYTLFADSYVIENGKRAVIGDDTGLGLILTMNATGSYTDNGDGTYTTSVPDHAVFEMETDTYSAQMKGSAQMNVNGNDTDGVYDSNDEPAVLDFVPETVWTLSGGEIVTYYNPAEAGAGEVETPEETASVEAPADGVTFPSDDGATTMTFYPDGTYRFYFEAYDIEDLGAYTYTDGVLTLTDANGRETTAEGDPLVFAYAYSANEQLTGSFTVAAADLVFEAAEGVTFPSEDGATTMTFYPDGTYRFYFEAYDIEDLGAYTYADGVLTLTDANGRETTAEGDPLVFTYAYSANEQLTGSFTVAAADLVFEAANVFPSDDGATTMTFNDDGTYVFAFEAYGIEDAGEWSFADGVLTVTNANGDVVTAEGDPLTFHYVSGVSEQLTGDFTIPADALAK